MRKIFVFVISFSLMICCITSINAQPLVDSGSGVSTNFVYQLNGNYCGPATIKNVAIFNGSSSASQLTIGNYYNIGSSGTSDAQMLDGCNRYGGGGYIKGNTANGNFDSNIKTSISHGKAVSVNVICGQLNGRYNPDHATWKHYILVYGYSGNYAYIFDPWYGYYNGSREGGYYTMSFSSLQTACSSWLGYYYYHS